MEQSEVETGKREQSQEERNPGNVWGRWTLKERGCRDGPIRKNDKSRDERIF